MKSIFLLAGAAALAIGAPVAAKPGGGQGQGKGANSAKMMKIGSAKSLKSGNSVRPVSSVKGTKLTRTTSARLDRNRNGILDRDEALARKYGGALCPPGLAKKTPACVPPGQAGRVFRDGQRVPGSYRYYTPYGDIPAVLVDRYDLTDQYRYIYRDNVIYVVDPATRLVTQVLDAIL